MTLAEVTVNTNLPGLPLQGFGTVGAETAALFLAVGGRVLPHQDGVRTRSGSAMSWP